MSLLALVSVLLLIPISLAHPDCSKERDAEVLILGAGFAGLGAAQTLSQNGIDDFLIIDQSDRVGGRAQSVQFGGVNVELGPQWILNVDPSVPEEQQQPLFRLARRCNITLREDPLGARGSRYYTREGVDISQSPDLLGAFARYGAATSPAVVGQILEALGDSDDLSLSAGLRAGGWLPRGAVDEAVDYQLVDFAFSEPGISIGYKSKFSPSFIQEAAFSFGSDIRNYIVIDDVGYYGLAQCIADEFLNSEDSRLVLDSTVQSVDWSDDCVCATVVQEGEEKEYCGRYAIVTFSTGVLQNRAVKFDPDLPMDIHLTLNKLQMGRFLKVYASFNETFWDADIDFIVIADDINGRDYYPLFSPWGAFFPSRAPVIEVYLSGEAAERVSFQDNEITRRQIGEVLRNVYGDEASDPLDVIMGDFISNPHYFGNLGGITTPGVTNDTYCRLNEPIGNIFLAGDGVAYGFHSTAHGALISGFNAGNRVVNAINQPPIGKCHICIIRSACT